MRIECGLESRIVTLAAALCAFAAAPAEALLYSSSQGYGYTSGSAGYHGHELWLASSLRVDGGWYPFARFAYTQDTAFRYIAAPTVGLEKGVEGLGRLRAGYTLYRGATREGAMTGTTHAAELGWYRAVTASVAFDASYHALTGDLFSQAYVFEAPDGTQGTRLGHSVYHEGSVSGSYAPSLLGVRPRLTAGLALEASPQLPRTVRESVGVSVPLAGAFSADSTFSFSQGPGGPFFASMGVSYGLSGRR